MIAMQAAPIPQLPTSGFGRLRRDQPHARLLARLNSLSVTHGHDPFVDIDWDAPENRIDPRDERLAIDPGHALAGSDWYAALAPEARTRFGLEWLAQVVKYGIAFEAVLCRGLLEFAQALPNGSPEFRYALHEIVEEARHSMMLQELIDRSGCQPHPLTALERLLDDRIAALGRSFPELFFFSVLAGEIFIDEQNREQLRRPSERQHPLVRRVMQIHVVEEARHVRFAASYLRERLPRLGFLRRERLAFTLPAMFSETSRMMLVPDRALCARYAIPPRTLRAAFGAGSAHRTRVAQMLAPVRALCEEQGLLRRRHALAWRAFGFAM
jgi:P-aminobenzoate N-oxygenase AurF